MEKLKVDLFREGDQYVVQMAGGIAVGYRGRGPDVASALEDLARQIRDDDGQERPYPKSAVS